MPVASWRIGDEAEVLRNFGAPKRASELKYWWMALRKVLPALPKYEDAGINSRMTKIDVETIIMGGVYGGESWCLMVARKRSM